MEPIKFEKLCVYFVCMLCASASISFFDNKKHNMLPGMDNIKHKEICSASNNHFSNGISSKHMSFRFIGNNFPLQICYSYICKYK
jgi:hypothetical protein